MDLQPERVSDLIEIAGSSETQMSVRAVIERTKALVPGHFAFPNGLHSSTALRFRAIARDPEALDAIATAVRERASWSWDSTAIVSPESAGFFLGATVARQVDRPHVVVQTDLRRRPTDKIVAGTLKDETAIVIVNDISNTGDSLRPLIDLARAKRLAVRGVLLFAVGDVGQVARFGHDSNVTIKWLATTRWTLIREGCSGCASRSGLIPIAELA